MRASIGADEFKHIQVKRITRSDASFKPIELRKGRCLHGQSCKVSWICCLLLIADSCTDINGLDHIMEDLQKPYFSHLFTIRNKGLLWIFMGPVCFAPWFATSSRSSPKSHDQRIAGEEELYQLSNRDMYLHHRPYHK